VYQRLCLRSKWDREDSPPPLIIYKTAERIGKGRGWLLGYMAVGWGGKHQRKSSACGSSVVEKDATGKQGGLASTIRRPKPPPSQKTPPQKKGRAPGGRGAQKKKNREIGHCRENGPRIYSCSALTFRPNCLRPIKKRPILQPADRGKQQQKPSQERQASTKKKVTTNPGSRAFV